MAVILYFPVCLQINKNPIQEQKCKKKTLERISPKISIHYSENKIMFFSFWENFFIFRQ